MARTNALALIAIVCAMMTGVISARAQGTGTAIFAGGCFWCVESDFDHVPGVTETISGYIGGNADNPDYSNYAASGNREAVRISFDPSVVSYAELLKIFFRTVDPTDAGGQFCDRGYSYSTAIYTLNEEQARLAEAAKQKAAKALGQSIATEIEKPAQFWPAEEYHQDYYEKNPLRYKYYRWGCGRDAAVEALWGTQAHMGLKP